MTNEEMLLQTLGTNEEAKTTLANILREYFPSVVSELSLPDRIVEKFYDWQFPFIYATNGPGARKWSVSVRALCERNPKLADLDAFFNASGTDGTFQETYGGKDTETNTDNSARRTKTEFNGVDDPTSQSTSESIVVEPVEGKNTTERKTEYGKTRTYADGRTWSQILADVMDTRGPVYLFINSFAQILREPAEDPCDMPVYPPSMQMSVEINALSPESPATASVINLGTLYNAMFELLLGIPRGATGAPGLSALMSSYTLTKESDPNVNDQITITAENFPKYFSRDPAIDDRCIFVAKNTSTGESFILGATCTTKLENYAVFTVVSVISTAQDLSNYAQIDGSYAGLGAGSLEHVTRLGTGANLNDCIPTDSERLYVWSCWSSAESVNIENIPSDLTGTFYLLVYKTWAGDTEQKYRIIQTLYECGGNKGIYHRSIDNPSGAASWGQWQKLAWSDGIYPTMGAGLDGDGNQISTTYAKLASPAFTGTPTAPTPAPVDQSGRIATTSFVHSVVGRSGRALYEHSFRFSHAFSATTNYVVSFSVTSHKQDPAETFQDIIDMCDALSTNVEIPASGGVYNTNTYPVVSVNLYLRSIFYFVNALKPQELSFYQASLSQVNDPLDADYYSIKDLQDGSIIYLKGTQNADA